MTIIQVTQYPAEELEDFVGAKFYCPHAVAESNLWTWTGAPARGGQGGQTTTLKKNQGGPGPSPPCRYQPWSENFQAIVCQLECGPVPNVMVALPNIAGSLHGAFCSIPQTLADAHY